MKFFSLLSTLAAAALTSCVSYQAHPLSAEASSAAFAGRSLSDPGLRQFLIEQKAEHGTWEVNRLSLAAAYFHPDVTVARAEAGELAAAIKTVAERLQEIVSQGGIGSLRMSAGSLAFPTGQALLDWLKATNQPFNAAKVSQPVAQTGGH